MRRTFLRSKIHRATVTEANLEYEGSITIDPVLLGLADMSVYEKVLVVNINNGNRFETYIIEGKPNSGTICLNGAAARLALPGDLVIIMTFCELNEDETKTHKPQIVKLDAENRALSAK